MVVDFDVQLHHLIELEVPYSAADGHAQRVADEEDRVMVLHESLIFGKQSAFGRGFHVSFQLGHTTLSGVAEDLIQHLQVLQVESLGETVCAEDRADHFCHFDNDGKRIAYQHRAHRGAKDDDQFGRLHQYQQLAMLHQIPADNGAEDDNNPNDREQSPFSRFSNNTP